MDVPGTDTDTMGTPPASPGAADSSGVLQESDSSSLHAQQAHGTAGKRVSRACARCSSSKRRCDGRRPACAVCMAIGVECQYSAASIRRGPPKGFRSGGAESVKAKLLRTLETTLRDLVGKLGEEQTESEIARLASDRGLRLTSAREQNAARGSPRTPMPSSLVSLPASLPSMMPVPEHAHGPGPAPLPFLHARADAFLGRDLSSSREQLPPHLNRKHPASSERETHSAKRARPNHAGTTRRLAWDDSPGAAWTSLEADPSRHRVEGEGGDILGINEHGDTMHRGSSSGLQLLSKRTLPPLPGTALPLPFGTPGGGRDVMRRAGSKESDSSRARGAQSSSPLVPKEGVRVPFPDPRRSGSGTCPSGFALSGARRSSSVHSNPGSPSIPSLMRPRNFNLGEMMPSNSSLSFDNGRTSPRARMRAGSATSPQAGPGSGPVHDYAPDSTHLPPTSPRSSDLTLRPLRKSRPSSGGIQTIEAPIDFVDPANDPVVTPEECRMLFGRYWHHVHSEWPVLFKPAIRNLAPEVILDHMEPCLLYAVYAIASCIVSRRREPSSAERGGDRGLIFYRRAERYLFATRLRPSVPSLQALFLLAMYAHGTGDLSQAWVYHNLSVAMALDMGLHRWPLAHLNLLHDVSERETRIRLIWHIYILGQMLSAEMGRPVTLKRSDIDVPFLSEEEEDEQELVDLDDFESADEDAGRVVAVGHRKLHVATCINQSITLFTILEGILTRFHSFGRKAALRKEGDKVRDLVVNYDEELESWHNAMPAQFRADELLAYLKRDVTAKFVPLPAFIAVEMWYHTAKLLLHRNFIPQDEGLGLSDVLNNESFIKATYSAQMICDMLETTAQYMRVDRLSTDLAYCFFTAAVTFIFNSRLGDKEIALNARRGYVLCREALVKLSETWPAASSHKQLLDGFSYLAEGVWDDESRSFVLPPSVNEAMTTGANAESVSRPGMHSESRRDSFSHLRRSLGPEHDPLYGEQAPATPGLHQSKGSASDSGSAAESVTEPASNMPLNASTKGPMNVNFEEQRPQTTRLYEHSAEGIPNRGPEIATSAQSYAPGLFDLEQVFFNEWRPGIQLAATAAAAVGNSNTNPTPTGQHSAFASGSKGWDPTTAAQVVPPQGSYLDQGGAPLNVLPASSLMTSASTSGPPDAGNLGSYFRPPANFSSASNASLPGVSNHPPTGSQSNSTGATPLPVISQQVPCQGTSDQGAGCTNPLTSMGVVPTSAPLSAPGLYYPGGTNANNELFQLMALLQLPPNFGL